VITSILTVSCFCHCGRICGS